MAEGLEASTETTTIVLDPGRTTMAVSKGKMVVVVVVVATVTDTAVVVEVEAAAAGIVTDTTVVEVDRVVAVEIAIMMGGDLAYNCET